MGLFLFLCRDALNLEQVPMYELERCLAMSRQSLRLQQVMTTLLNTPFQRKRSPSVCAVSCVLRLQWLQKVTLCSCCFMFYGYSGCSVNSYPLLVLFHVFYDSGRKRSPSTVTVAAKGHPLLVLCHVFYS